MQLVDEEYDILSFLKLIHYRFHAFLELTAVFRSGHKGCKVQSYNALIV